MRCSAHQRYYVCERATSYNRLAYHFEEFGASLQLPSPDKPRNCTRQTNRAGSSGWSAGPGSRTISRVPDDTLDDERDLCRDDQWMWATEQAEALRRRDLDAVDWEHLMKAAADLASGIRCDWVSRCVQAVEKMLLIEHYPATAYKISVCRAGAWRRR